MNATTPHEEITPRVGSGTNPGAPSMHHRSTKLTWPLWPKEEASGWPTVEATKAYVSDLALVYTASGEKKMATVITDTMKAPELGSVKQTAAKLKEIKESITEAEGTSWPT